MNQPWISRWSFVVGRWQISLVASHCIKLTAPRLLRTRAVPVALGRRCQSWVPANDQRPTTNDSFLPTTGFLRCRLHFLRSFNHFVNRAFHVEGLFRNVVILACHDIAEALHR